MRGGFITLEGGEGTGKSTQAALLGEAFVHSGRMVRTVRSPGGPAVAEKLRTILKTREPGENLTPETELLLFGACHSQIDMRMLDEINRFSCRGLNPDLTIVLDIPPELGIRRSTGRAAKEEFENDRFDSETLQFHTAVRNGFLKLAELEPERIKIIAAGGTVEEVARAVRECVNHELGLDLF